MLDFYLRESFNMMRIRGFVGVAGLLVLLIAVSLSESHMKGQPTATLEVLDERGRENRKRIEAIESNSTAIERRLIVIETELSQSRKQSEYNGNILSGLLIGIGLILAERAFVFVSYYHRRSQQ